MKLRPIILITLIVLVPLAALTWAVLRIAENEQVVVQQRFREVLEDRLQDVNAGVITFFEAAERDLSRITAIDHFDITDLRQVNRREPRLLQLFVLNPEGQLAYPDPSESVTPLNGNERLFLFEAAKMFTGQDLRESVIRSEQEAVELAKLTAEVVDKQTRGVASANVRASDQRQQQQTDQREIVQHAYQKNPVQNLAAFKESSGWFIWYWDRGLNLIYWQRRPSGHIVGCALERARWMADLIAQLPDTVHADSRESRGLETRIRLVNAAGKSVYQWGTFEPPKTSKPFCEVPVASPLASWRLQCFVPIAALTAGTGRTASLGLVAILCAVATTLGICAFFFVREYARDMREASQQVSFVNQVSHELKTPLTNIRMYAELLDGDLDRVEAEDAEKPRQRLDVILSEGQRLSRLIGNVLTFARHQRKTLQVQARESVPGKLIHQIVDRFRPALAEQQIEIQVNTDIETRLQIDPDFLEQILGNLISNVEKYAATGGLLKVDGRIDGQMLTIDVCDSGPGIDASKRTEIFEPFARVCNDVSYAAGTGIGLPIARELARLHGGDLTLVEVGTGCCFRATLKGQTGG